MKIYISGKITGLHKEEYEPKFRQAEEDLIAAGIRPENIVNPCKLGIPEDGPWKEAMDVCLEALKPCTAIFMLRDWKDSFGAKWELTHAGEQRKDIYFEANGDLVMIKECINAGVL